MTALHLFQLTGLLFGLLLGSFLNVCISRVPRGESIVAPRSRCPFCAHPIRWYDNIPILSWLLLRSRCRDCNAPIPWRYPLVELATGLWFARQATSLYEIHNAIAIDGWTLVPELTVQTMALAILGFLLIGLIVIDWQTQRLPDAFTLSGIAAGLFLVCIQAIFLQPGEDQIVLNTTHQLRLSSPGSFAAKGNIFLTGPEALIFGRIAAVGAVALFLLLIRWSYRALRHRDGLGLGDVKMLAMVAAFLGLQSALLTLFLGVLLAALYGVFLLSRRKAGPLTRLPLGSFLGIAALYAASHGRPLIEWYGNLFH